MLKHFSRFRRLFAGVTAVSALVATGVVTASVASPGQVLALPGATESTVVTVDPTRVLDTRSNIGVTGKFSAGTSQKLQVTGTINTWIEANQKSTSRVVVPVGATGVLLNVTAVRPTGAGFLSIRPGNATGVPATSGLNFTPGDVVANTITVAVPTAGANAGEIDLYYGTGTTRATMDVVIDVFGYTTNTGLLDLVNRVTALENQGAGGGGPVDGDACVAGGIAGTTQTYFDSGGIYVVRCARPGDVTTFAGKTGVAGWGNGTGTAASFNVPSGVAVDADGNVYVADRDNHLIRKITPAGEVTTLAGTAGVSGATNGNGTAASFFGPYGVAVDKFGNVYVAENGNHLIRKIDSYGEVTTLAGTAGVAGSTNANGTAASFKSPRAVAVDTFGNVYVADYRNQLVRKIDSYGEVTTLAGNDGVAGSDNGNGTAASFNGPGGVAVDKFGNVYVAEEGNNLIRKIDSYGEVTTLAGTAGVDGSDNGNGTAASFTYPRGVAVDTAGNVYVADWGNHLIRKIDSYGEVTTLAGTAGVTGATNGNGTAASFNWPEGVAVDPDGNFYVTDTDNNLIRKISPAA